MAVRPSTVKPQTAGAQADELSRQQRERVADLVAGLAMTSAGDAVTEELTSDNAVNLAAGDHGGFRLIRQDGLILGPVAGVRIIKPVILGVDAILEGLFFDSHEPGALVTLSTATATVIFRACRWRKRAQDTSTCLTMPAGARAILVGCLFDGGPATPANLITNPGLVTAVQVVACYNKTVHLYGNVTIIASF